MKPVILITSCAYDLHRNAQCRSTWLALWGQLIEYRFVLGAGNTPTYSDEIIVDVGDDYASLPAKIQASHKWALDHGYDYVLKTDCDVYVHIPRLLKSGFDSYPYSGNFYWPDANPPFALGAAYWLDKTASKILINSPLPAYPAKGGDDMWVGKVMFENVVPHHHESRYCVGHQIDWDTAITVHISDTELEMTEIHKKFE